LNLLFSRIFSFTWSSRSAVTKDGRPLLSSSWALVLPSLNILHHLLTIPSLTAFSPYTLQTCRANIFVIKKIHHWPYVTTRGIFNFHTHFKTKWRTYKQRLRTDNVSDLTSSVPESSSRRRTPLQPPAQPVYAIGT
jgi:hypothetical protein